MGGGGRQRDRSRAAFGGRTSSLSDGTQKPNAAAYGRSDKPARAVDLL